MLRAGARRFGLMLAAAVVPTGVGALLIGLLAGASAARSVSIGFYCVGSFLLVAGFFVGNRGPVRLRRETTPLGARFVRWATPEERTEAINTSALFVVLGLVLISLGIVVDNRYSLI